MNVNKKLWSFIFGCLIAASFVWLISLGKSFDVIEYFHQYPEFVDRLLCLDDNCYCDSLFNLVYRINI